MGVSIPNPLNQFHLNNSAIRLTGNVQDFGGPMLLFGGDRITVPNREWGVEYSTSDQGINFWKPFGANSSSGNYFMFFKKDGHVGINTNNPTA